jgi:hypothetical protein
MNFLFFFILYLSHSFFALLLCYCSKRKMKNKKKELKCKVLLWQQADGYFWQSIVCCLMMIVCGKILFTGWAHNNSLLILLHIHTADLGKGTLQMCHMAA